MPCVVWEKIGKVGFVRLNTAENRFNPESVDALLMILETIEKDPDISSLVLLSADVKNWSLGIDLEWMTQTLGRQALPEIRAFMYRLNDLFRRILLYPMPVVAAINGHVFGGGAILACACDFRFMKADRGYFCLPEVDIHIPFLPGMLAILSRAIPQSKLQELILTGKRATAPELEAHQVIQKACPNEEALVAEVLAFAQGFAKGRTIFAELKKRMNESILSTLEKEDPDYIEPLQLMV